MLVLSRDIEQSIIIGGTIKVTVLGFRNGQVRLGIDAPRDVPVYRSEVWRAIQAAKGETVEGGFLSHPATQLPPGVELGGEG